MDAENAIESKVSREFGDFNQRIEVVSESVVPGELMIQQDGEFDLLQYHDDSISIPTSGYG